MALVVDIETVGLSAEQIPPRALDYLLHTIRREEVGEEEIEARQREMFEKFGLDPTTGMVACIGLLDTETGEEQALSGTEERPILVSFWERLGRARPEIFVTFNGKSFDFPFINLRSAILQVPPSMSLPMRRHSTHPHFDVREVLAGDERHRRGNLDYFCAIFGIASPKAHLDGKGVGQAYQDGRIEEIARYCLADCRATAALYERLKAFYGAQV